MAGGLTNRGKYRISNGFFRGQNIPTHFYIVLCTSATSPTKATNTLSQLTEIAPGNGYVSGGYEINRDTTDFDSLVEDDGVDKALLQLKDVIWTAGSGGNIPASGSGARWAVMTDDNGTLADRDVFVFWDFGSDRSVSPGQNLSLQNLEIDGTEGT